MVQSKQILSAPGYLSIDFTFKVLEIKRKTFFTHGNSAMTMNIKAHRNKIMKDAIYNGYKKKFPTGTYTMYDIIIMSYNIVYYVDRYMIVHKDVERKDRKGKKHKETVYYEKYRDKVKKRTVYSKISDKKEYSPEQEGYK